MREIKFRGWDVIVKRMYYAGECKLSIDFFGHIFDDEENPPRNVGYRNIIMQFTGLCDKNGKEIYEGDLILIGKDIVQVIWNKNDAQWDLLLPETDEYEEQAYEDEVGLTNHESFEIIGNAWENPELLSELET